MAFLAELFIGKPVNILMVGLLCLAPYLFAGFIAEARRRRFFPMLIASAVWGAYAAWEWFVLAKSPEANIRFDLMLIWPAAALISAWALYRVLRPRGTKNHDSV